MNEKAQLTPGYATVLFLSIVELRKFDGPTILTLMTKLHTVIRDLVTQNQGSSPIRLLSCVTGSIVVIPDRLNFNVLTYLSELSSKLTTVGLAVRVGGAHGRVEPIEDADGAINVIGVCVN